MNEPTRPAAVPALDREPDRDFSLFLGGPLYQLRLRTRSVRPPFEILHRPGLAIIVVC